LEFCNNDSAMFHNYHAILQCFNEIILQCFCNLSVLYGYIVCMYVCMYVCIICKRRYMYNICTVERYNEEHKHFNLLYLHQHFISHFFAASKDMITLIKASAAILPCFLYANRWVASRSRLLDFNNGWIDQSSLYMLNRACSRCVTCVFFSSLLKHLANSDYTVGQTGSLQRAVWKCIAKMIKSVKYPFEKESVSNCAENKTLDHKQNIYTVSPNLATITDFFIWLTDRSIDWLINWLADWVLITFTILYILGVQISFRRLQKTAPLINYSQNCLM